MYMAQYINYLELAIQEKVTCTLLLCVEADFVGVSKCLAVISTSKVKFVFDPIDPSGWSLS